MDVNQVSFGYSVKNIPLPSKKEYILKLTHSIREAVYRLRWRVDKVKNPLKYQSSKETYGFRSTQPAPFRPELQEFESKMQELVQNIEFRNVTNSFQTKLESDIQNIEGEPKLFVQADKTTNFYKLDPKFAENLKLKNITKEYKKADAKVISDINKEAYDIAERLKIADRVYATSEKEAFVTLKDHKENFKNDPKCRLLNPTKTELGKISKKKVSDICDNVRSQTNLTQWKNSYEFVKWFKTLSEKESRKFIQFDIDNFYPSISEELINKAITWASQYVDISEEDKKLIFHTCKTLLYHNGEAWVKKGESNVDVGMGSYDGAEKCDLIGLFILSQLRTLRMECGLFRDDGLGVSTAGLTSRQVENIKKKICSIFRENGLSITIKANLDIVEFLDTEVCLSNGTYRVFTKPNNTLQYIDVKSNHSKSMINNIPFGVQKRLSALSSSEEIFNQTAPQYQEALERSGHQHKLKFEEPATSTRKFNRKRNITWFTPPFSLNVKTNVGAKTLRIIDTCFPKENKLSEIINRNTFKVSYSTMPSFKQVISKHNIKTSNQDRPITAEQRDLTGCNCRKMVCPMRGECKPDKIIYKATVTREDTGQAETYTGLTAGSFKQRWRTHDSSFNNKHLSNTELSKHIWKLKDKNVPHKIHWEKIGRAQGFNPTSSICRLCLLEKYFIMFRKDGATLNKNSEFYTPCMHRKTKIISNV